MKNLDIRQEVKNAGVRLWQVSDKIRLTETS